MSAAPVPTGGAGQGPSPGLGGGALDLADLIQHYWAVAFLATCWSTVASSTRGTTWDKLRRGAWITLLVLCAWRAERELSERVLIPALRRAFGDNDELRRRVEAEERDALARLAQLRRGADRPPTSLGPGPETETGAETSRSSRR